jgi:hypothetical protein
MALATWTIEEVKTGHIRPFYGLRADIPSGWVECDGNNGTPNLRGSYPKGAGAIEEANVTGGNLTHSHTNHASQTHTGGAVGAISATATAAVKIGTSASSAASNAHTHPAPSFTQPTAHPALSHDSPNHEPPYRTCIWIMKI